MIITQLIQQNGVHGKKQEKTFKMIFLNLKEQPDTISAPVHRSEQPWKTAKHRVF